MRLAGALETAVPNAVVARRPLQDTAASLISSGAFDPIVRRAALVLHGALFTQNAENVSLDLADGLQLLNSFVSAQQPALRGQVAPACCARVVSLRNQGPIRVVSGSGRLIGVLAWSLTLLALLLFAASVAVARNRVGRWDGSGSAWQRRASASSSPRASRSRSASRDSPRPTPSTRR